VIGQASTGFSHPTNLAFLVVHDEQKGSTDHQLQLPLYQFIACYMFWLL
jgi:hypothetical protein